MAISSGRLTILHNTEPTTTLLHVRSLLLYVYYIIDDIKHRYPAHKTQRDRRVLSTMCCYQYANAGFLCDVLPPKCKRRDEHRRDETHEEPDRVLWQIWKELCEVVVVERSVPVLTDFKLGEHAATDNEVLHEDHQTGIGNDPPIEPKWG